MNCVTVLVGTDPRGKFLHRCITCGKSAAFRSERGGTMVCGVKAPEKGPGTELRLIFQQLGIKPKRGCGCAELAAAMNLSLIHISEPTRLLSISYAVFCLKKKKK